MSHFITANTPCIIVTQASFPLRYTGIRAHGRSHNLGFSPEDFVHSCCSQRQSIRQLQSQYLPQLKRHINRQEAFVAASFSKTEFEFLRTGRPLVLIVLLRPRCSRFLCLLHGHCAGSAGSTLFRKAMPTSVSLLATDKSL